MKKRETSYGEAAAAYGRHLEREERSENTRAKYRRDLGAFLAFTGGGKISKGTVVAWKERLTETHAPASVNSMLAPVNGFLSFVGLARYRVKPLKIQRAVFARPERELGREEYRRLVKAAEQKENRRLSLLLQTLCATGIRVSELRFITVEAAERGRAAVDCKGKSRTVLLPRALCRLLLRYCKGCGIAGGYVFRTAKGAPLDRSNIWKDMKALCKGAGVDGRKVFPHNLRHLFAKTYYSQEKDLSRLADLLGHSSVSTTRIYTMESGLKHARQLERMGLVCSPA